MTNEHIGAPETMRRYRPAPADAGLAAKSWLRWLQAEHADVPFGPSGMDVPFDPSGVVVDDALASTDAWTLYRACTPRRLPAASAAPIRAVSIYSPTTRGGAGGSYTAQIFQSDDALVGNEAYDRLGRITAVDAYGSIGGEFFELAAVDPEPDGGAVRPSVIRVICTVDRGGGRKSRLALMSDVAITGEATSLGSECRPFVTPSTQITVDELSELMELAAFTAWEDRESDSWDTQHDEFMDEARAQATALLVSEDEGRLMRIRDYVRALPWLLKDHGAVIRVGPGDKEIEIELIEPGSVEPGTGDAGEVVGSV